MDQLTVLPNSVLGGQDDIASQVALLWGLVKVPLIVPLLRVAVMLCLVMSVMLFVERVYMSVVIFLLNLFRRKAEKKYKFEPLKEDVELGNSSYPMVLVQIPMFNEREVYQLSIGAACGLSWPSGRLVIQVLDDSTDITIKEMVERECQRWASKGINIKYEVRDNRKGYKAGALKEGMKRGYVKSCDFVVIFDADFQPESDFLTRTIPYLVHNPELALVQARWKFVHCHPVHCQSFIIWGVTENVKFRIGVYQLSIGAACGLSWPSGRLVIQVLDDSTDITIKEMVERECQRWASKGINIKYEVRDNRKGYKAGALKEGMKRGYVKSCDFVVIFDADFQPESDFLTRTIPYLVHNPELALVQARWKFVNADECLMTRLQEMSLDYHFTVEQEVGSSTYNFFGFNGTAGVWRISALNEAGGWKDRTTVEDMDLAVRASLKGWKFLYVGTVQVKNELPSTFKAYRYQQHRWSCGPANLFRKMSMEIIRNKKVSLWKKVHVIYSFFFVRKIIAHIITFMLYCIVLPATVVVPEVQVPKWGAVYIPTVITILNAVGTPRSLHLLVFWILFENVMSLHRTIATFIGLIEGVRVNEWIVTEKLGGALKAKTAAKAPRMPRLSFGDRVYLLEIGVGAFLFTCGCYDVLFGHNYYFVYLFVQALAFFIIGFGYIGIFVPRS